MSFYAAKSEIDGRGLFSTKPFAPGSIVCPFRNQMGLRWINHSRTPNATITKKDGKLRIVALRTIPAGTEITVDYRNPLNPFRKKYAFSL